VIVTVLPPLFGSNVYVPEASVENDVPFVLPWTESVWLRAPQAVDGGSFSTTLPIENAVPRSTCTHCGNALLALSQYVFASPSVAFEDGNPP
jgi:hypothetical protein